MLPKTDRDLVAHLSRRIPPVAKQLTVLLRRKISESLTQILNAVLTATLKGFTVGLFATLLPFKPRSIYRG